MKAPEDGRAPPRRLAPRIAIAVLLLAVGALLSWQGSAIWGVFAYGPVERQLGVDFQLARWPWLPGPGARIPPQVCPACRGGHHEICAKREGTVYLPVSDVQPPPPGSPVGLRLDLRPRRESDPPDPSFHVVPAVIEIDGITVSPEHFRCPCCAR